jgi:hypothetical protein
VTCGRPVLISFGSEFHTSGPLKEKLDLFNSIFVFGTRKLSDDENLVSYDSLLFAETIRFDKYSGANYSSPLRLLLFNLGGIVVNIYLKVY